MNGLPKDHDGFVRRLAGSLGIQRGHVFRGHASPDNKDRQQQDQPGYGEPVLSLSPHVPSGYFRALFNTRTARKPLPALLATCSPARPARRKYFGPSSPEQARSAGRFGALCPTLYPPV